MADDSTLPRFLERIAPAFGGATFALPLPSAAVGERMRQRVLHRNEENLYRAQSSLSGTPLISIYPPGVPFPVISREEWFSEAWDPLQSGVAYDPRRGFFEQLAALNTTVPRAATVTLNNENSEFTTGTAYCKNCYLINSSEECRDCYYSKLLQSCRDVVDSSYCYDSELLYECFNVRNCYDCRWVYNSDQCSECAFCDDLRSCRNCLFCTNLTSQQYCIYNQQVSAEKFHEQLGKLSRDPVALRAAVQKFDELRVGRWYRPAESIGCEQCSGDFLRNSRNCVNCYDVVDSEDCTNVQVGIKARDLYDCSNMYLGPELSYSVLGTIGTYNVHLSLYVFHSSDLWYCEQCFSCKKCFGCVGLRQREYCILNKQYSAAEYEMKVREIVQAMVERGEWGAFFPASVSPFPYNTSLAQEYLPLDRDGALAAGYQWEEIAEGDAPALSAAGALRALDAPDSLCEETLRCIESGRSYRIQRGELAFYRKMDLPIPDRAPKARYHRRVRLRPERQLRDAVCQCCKMTVKTTLPGQYDQQILCDRDYLEKVRQ